MNELKITIGDDGQTVTVHSASIETLCAGKARSIHALADVLTAADGLKYLASCSAQSQGEVFRLLRSLTQEQMALTAALEANANPAARDESFRRAFRTGYSAGLQRTSSTRGEIDMNEAAIRTAAFQPSTMEH
ncbi:hypothetical protein [Caballeronia sp. BR00000012568055]|uniref:hypothetical protein n=1 Tax=Caballeronia sp. BR00000012568055 TaxID=2918761 RepID=UPI0023F6C3DA|nr:hypothetical protein [Caballeronia sp. BR00000012568055]